MWLGEDYVLLSLSVWPDGLTMNDIPLTSNADLASKLNFLRGKVSTLTVDFMGVLTFYNAIIEQFMYWLMVSCRFLFNANQYQRLKTSNFITQCKGDISCDNN